MAQFSEITSLDNLFRVCKECHQRKNLTEFARNKGCRFGRVHTCKLCKSGINRELYKKKPQKNARKLLRVVWEHKTEKIDYDTALERMQELGLNQEQAIDFMEHQHVSRPC